MVEEELKERKNMETVMQAVHLVENNQVEKALKMLEDYLPVADEEEKFTIAQLYLQWGYLTESSVILHQLLDIYPEESELRIMLAEIYTELEQDEEAIQQLNMIDPEDESYVQALVQLADLYQSQGLFEVAEQKLFTAKRIQPEEKVIDFALGELYYSTGDYQHAIVYYERLGESEFAQVSITERLAESYASAGKYEEALQFYQASHLETPDALFKYGITAQQAKRSDIAIKVWEKVIEIDPYYHTVYNPLAKAYEEEELLDKAYDTVQKGLDMDEFNKELYYYGAILAKKLGKAKESENLARKSIALDPDYKEAIVFLIASLKDKDDPQAVIELIQEIQRTGAEDSAYDWEMARAFNQIESYEDALKYYQRAYINLKDDSEFLKEYGYFLSEEGRSTEACHVLQAYLEIVPTDIETEEFVQRLQQA